MMTKSAGKTGGGSRKNSKVGYKEKKPGASSKTANGEAAAKGKSMY